MTASGVPVPEDLVPVGHVTGAYGIQGWVRIKPYSADASALLHVKTWWLDKPELHDMDMRQARWQGDEVVAQLMGVASRDAAEALKGAVVQISRRYFPALENDEYYWVDLIGLDVVNLQGVQLGRVSDLMDNGAHPILRVAVLDQDGSDAKRETLIPFVDRFISSVDQTAKIITVDWEPDY